MTEAAAPSPEPDFVREYGSKFAFVRSRGDKPGVDRNKAAREREGVD